MTLQLDIEIAEILPLTDLPIIFWRNVVNTSNIQATNEDPSFPASNLANASLGLKWKQDFTDSPISTPPDYITVDLANVAGPVNYVAIAGHNFGTLGVNVGLEGLGGGFGSPFHEDSPAHVEFVTGFVPIDDGPIIFMFAEVEGGDVRIRFNNPSITTAAECAVVYVGKATVLQEGIQADHSPLPLAKRNDTQLAQSENGSFLGRIVLGSWHESTAVIANLTADWVRDELLDFLDFAAEFPFFYAWQPLTYPDETAFAYLDNDPAPVFDIDKFASIELAMKGVTE